MGIVTPGFVTAVHRRVRGHSPSQSASQHRVRSRGSVRRATGEPTSNRGRENRDGDTIEAPYTVAAA